MRMGELGGMGEVAMRCRAGAPQSQVVSDRVALGRVWGGERWGGGDESAVASQEGPANAGVASAGGSKDRAGWDGAQAKNGLDGGAGVEGKGREGRAGEVSPRGSGLAPIERGELGSSRADFSGGREQGGRRWGGGSKGSVRGRQGGFECGGDVFPPVVKDVLEYVLLMPIKGSKRRGRYGAVPLKEKLDLAQKNASVGGFEGG